MEGREVIVMSRKSTKNSTKEIPVICNVDLVRYLGRWHEIARFPHVFEKGLDNVAAEYSLMGDGRIRVNNAGLKNGKESAAKAVAWVPDEGCKGKLFVRFFWPFKSEYRIIKLDEKDYQFAVVTGNTKNYLWILSREPEISDELYKDLVAFVASHGFDTSQIIKVNQNNNKS